MIDAGPWRVEIPDWHPTGLNRLLSLHWAERRKVEGLDRRMVLFYCMKCGVPRATGKRRVTMTYVKRRRDGGVFPDDDNLWKSFLDALVAAGMLVDDSPDWVEKSPVRYIKREGSATIIELEDIGQIGSNGCCAVFDVGLSNP